MNIFNLNEIVHSMLDVDTYSCSQSFIKLNKMQVIYSWKESNAIIQIHKQQKEK